MEYKKIGTTYYIRVDYGEEIISTIRNVCQKEYIQTAYFQGIGACSEANCATYVAEKDDFIQHHLEGMLELISLSGNITLDEERNLFFHTHALFSYLDEQGHPAMLAGHLTDATVHFTGEITLVPAQQAIGRKIDPVTGITVWDLSD